MSVKIRVGNIITEETVLNEQVMQTAKCKDNFTKGEVVCAFQDGVSAKNTIQSEDTILEIAYSRDGRFFAVFARRTAGSYLFSVFKLIYDGEQIISDAVKILERSMTSAYRDLVFSQDGNWIALATEEKSILYVMDVSGDFVEFDAFTSNCITCDITPDNKFLLAGYNGEIKLYQVDTTSIRLNNFYTWEGEYNHDIDSYIGIPSDKSMVRFITTNYLSDGEYGYEFMITNHGFRGDCGFSTFTLDIPASLNYRYIYFEICRNFSAYTDTKSVYAPPVGEIIDDRYSLLFAICGEAQNSNKKFRICMRNNGEDRIVYETDDEFTYVTGSKKYVFALNENTRKVFAYDLEKRSPIFTNYPATHSGSIVEGDKMSTVKLNYDKNCLLKSPSLLSTSDKMLTSVYKLDEVINPLVVSVQKLKHDSFSSGEVLKLGYFKESVNALGIAINNDCAFFWSRYSALEK